MELNALEFLMVIFASTPKWVMILSSKKSMTTLYVALFVGICGPLRRYLFNLFGEVICSCKNPLMIIAWIILEFTDKIKAPFLEGNFHYNCLKREGY